MFTRLPKKAAKSIIDSLVQATMEGKKISFGFLKTKKLEKFPVQEKKDFIECVEEQSIKVIGGEEVNEIVPLVIPMKPNTLVTTERLREIAERVESSLEEPVAVETPPKVQETVPENETLDQMAVRELLEDSKKAVKLDTSQLTLLLPAKSVTSGEKESTLDDYDSVPVQEFGLAMLRGMGWTKTNEKSTFKPPQLRPKGLGLGADKVVKDKQKVTKNSKDEELTIIKNAYVKITTGRYSGYYGKVLSLDEDNGRVMVDITVKKETVSLSEFMMHPVSKSEFDKESKVINASSFEQYKKEERRKKEGQATSKNCDGNPKRDREGNNSKDNKEKENEKQNIRENNRDRSNRERHRDSSTENYRKDNRESSQESASDSDSGRKYKEERKQYRSMEPFNTKKHSKRDKAHDSSSESDRGKKNTEQRKHDSDLREKRSERRQDSESDRNKNVDKERYSSDSESDDRKNKERKRRDSTDRRSKRSDTPEGKRDIDKKRKGKKKKRDRDRSPNHRKHRK